MHSHLPIRHLIRYVEERRTIGEGQPVIPQPITAFIHAVCELFEPYSGVARAGYECLYGDDRWEISVFLGETECYGGAGDGELLPVNFRFDVAGLRPLFDELHSLQWNAIPNAHIHVEMTRFESFLTVEGTVGRQPVSLQVHALAPEAVGPALRRHVDGRMELV
jgi:hypothetical protein